MSRTRVLVPLATGVEELEAVAIVDILRRAGAHVITASVGASNPIVGRNRMRLMADLDISEALDEWGDQWHLIALPGGPAVGALEEHVDLMQLLKARIETGQPVAAICAAPRLLAAAGLNRQTLITNHPSCRSDLDEFAHYKPQPVVVSGGVITSRGAGTAVSFGLACVELLFGKPRALEIAKEIVA